MIITRTIAIVALSLCLVFTAGCTESDADSAPEQAAPAETAAPEEGAAPDESAGHGHDHGDGHGHSHGDSAAGE